MIINYVKNQKHNHDKENYYDEYKRLLTENGIEFDNVLLAENNGKFSIGADALKGAKVSAKILSHLKGEKVIVFKKKRRKGYKKKNGHRQMFTKIEITGITL